MKILLYGINFAPELTGIGKYTGELAAWLAARGHDVRVVTAPPYYPAWAVSPGYSGCAYRTEQWQGVRVVRCPLWVPRQRIRNAVAAAERWLMRRFDVVSTISQRMHQRLLAKGVDAPKARLAVNWVNWVDMAQFALPSVDGVAAYRRELNIPHGAVVALYSGNMCGKQGLEVLAEVAKLSAAANAHPGFRAAKRSAQVKEEPAKRAGDTEQSASPPASPEVVFVFCGNGAGRADLVARCQGLPNVRFIALQPAELLPDLLATADIHLLPQRADAADLVMPSKLTVVQTCGLVVPPKTRRHWPKPCAPWPQTPRCASSWAQRAMCMPRPIWTGMRCCKGLRQMWRTCWGCYKMRSCLRIFHEGLRAFWL